MRPPGPGRLRQHNHRTTKSKSFWEDGGHADVATGRGVLSLRSFVGKALALFLMHEQLRTLILLSASTTGLFAHISFYPEIYHKLTLKLEILSYNVNKTK
ncbi:hypothetical protein PBF_19083 [Cytobacillus firmus DS1]|uniref:Uncharacterized protein n=1 Tax=Cytobacillus firmus DS1 TaxID=1307436 RepID=W7L1G9_CYTFI|nr:hypothetical protein PBF_19083 [Cytobacillus firmus DS1]